ASADLGSACSKVDFGYTVNGTIPRRMSQLCGLPSVSPGVSPTRIESALIPSPRFDELKTTGKLPSPAGVALAVIDLCRQDNVSVDSISRAVCADPALSGRIIKFANSAANGARRPIV